MIGQTGGPELCSLQEGTKRLVAQARDTAVPFRIETAMAMIDPLVWLAGQLPATRLYWRSRDGDYEMAGIGVADERTTGGGTDLPVNGVGLSYSAQDGRTEGRYLGGLRFDSGRTPTGEEWNRFGNGRFVLPLVELIRNEDNCVLVGNLQRESDREELLSLLERGALPNLPVGEHLPAPVARLSNPDRLGFERIISEALALIRSGQLAKIALARTLVLEFGVELNPWQLLTRMRQCAELSFLFGFQIGDGSAFIGTTPERLYQRAARQISTEAVAGTRERGRTADEDIRLGVQLLQSEKERREHQYVIDALSRSLTEVTTEFAFRSTGLVKLNHLQHLAAEAEGILRPEITDSQLLALLPPTPAVGGCPREAAVEAIRRMEPFDRGWYAGPVGWLGPNSAEFAVGIRSMLVTGHRLTAYAGVGIVAGSTPETEWQETEQKLASFVGRLFTT